MMFQQGSLRQSYLIGTPLYKQAKSDSVILLGAIQKPMFFTSLMYNSSLKYTYVVGAVEELGYVW